MQKLWHIASDPLSPLQSLPHLEQFLWQQRNLDEAGRLQFLEPQYDRDVHDPYLMYGMAEAVDRVYQAVKAGERILVWGDYDMDGVAATTILVTTLQDIGAHVFPYLPHRIDDGYSLNRDVLEHMIDEFDLLITVDCGISSIEEVAWVTSKGKDVIVTDHHEIGQKLPAARAVIHPRHPKGSYPWGPLAGAGVAWKFAQAFLRDTRSPFAKDPDKEKWLLDAAMMGTVGDIMPLLGENRAIVRFGLEVLRRTKRPGLRALMEATRLRPPTLTVEEVAFRLVPLVNAAGRIDHPQAALDVLMAADAVRGQKYAKKLVQLNTLRQTLTRKIVKEAEKVVDSSAPVIFAANVSWPAGIVGLVAGKLASKFKKPAVVVGGNGKHAVGSARSSGGVNILEGMRQAQDHTLKLGGHSGAVGFSLLEDRITSFQEALNVSFAAIADPKSILPSAEADVLVQAALLDWNTHDLLRQFEPFGEANRKPLFAITNMSVMDHRTVGADGQHIKLQLAVGEQTIDGIGFDLAEELTKAHEKVDVIGALETNEYKGQQKLQLRIEDIAEAGTVVLKQKSA